MKLKLPLILFLLINSALLSQWSQVITTGSVPFLTNSSAVYVSSQNSIFVFGGRTPSGNKNEIRKLNLSSNQWIQVIPSNIPPPERYTQNAYYDSVQNRMIIWSGQGNELYNDVWAYSLTTNEWQQLWPDGNTSGVPLKRYGTGSIFDPVTRNIYTFAGFTTSGRFEDTWTFHIDNMIWRDKTNTPHPPKRCLHSACFAYDTRRMIIYGGQDTGPLDDIWSLDMNNFMWQNLTPQFNPPGRFFYSMVYTGGGNIIVFGGLSSAALGDMWKFSMSNNSWEQVNQNSPAPAARWGHVAVYIPASGKMIIFGGAGATDYNDTWQYSNAGTIGIKNTSIQIPDNFRLEQNYPNPFNPVTNIKFSVPQGNKPVQLKVFDLTGREIKTLVNENLQPGTYSVDFDGSGYSSGVYFYTISSGSFSATRKMIILK